MAPYPEWLHVLAWTWIAASLACALGLLIHALLHPQKMTIMGIVWPVTALYLGPVAVVMYRKGLPVSTRRQLTPEMQAVMQKAQNRAKDKPPTFFQNSVAVFHCGAGCSLGDLVAESIVPTFGIFFAGEFGSKLILDFAFAYILGIIFQYFTIAPMRGLSFGKGLAAAARADTISILLFEVGMFGWMALSWYVLFPAPHLDPGMAVFWFMMQIAMITGFFTALPANAWLIRKGWKEKMPAVDPRQMEAAMRESRGSRAA